MAAENAPVVRHVWQPALASMRPRLIAAENGAALAHDLYLACASMRPRLIAAENCHHQVR